MQEEPVQPVHRPRILIVGAFPPSNRHIVGGIVTCCKILLGSSLGERAELELVDTTQIGNPPPSFLIRLVLAVRRCFVYLIRMEAKRPTAVLLFCAGGAGYVEKSVMAWYARIRGIPALMMPRGQVPSISPDSRLKFKQRWLRIISAGSLKVLCQGLAWQRFAIDTLGFAENDAVVVHNWTATPSLLSIGRKRQHLARVHPVRIVFLGWLEQEKGIFELIEACKCISSSHRFEVDIVGDGRASLRAQELVEAYGLECRIRFHGWMNSSQVEVVLARSDVLALPSWSEGLPNAMIEAMAARLAIIVSSVGNIPDIVTNDVDALIVPPRDVIALRIALSTMIDDPALRKRLADNAFQLAERLFGVERAVERILAAVEDCALAKTKD